MVAVSAQISLPDKAIDDAEDWDSVCTSRYSTTTGRRAWVAGPIFTALHVMQTRYCDENSVCLSVRLSVRLSVCPSHAWIVTKR